MIYIIVAFRIDQPNSILYAKCTSLTGLAARVIEAFRKGAHFISLRGVE